MKVLLFILCAVGLLQAQPRYDLLLKNGHVIDPGNERDAVMDVAIEKGAIARVAPNIPSGQARKVIDAQGLYVTPGLIDLHATCSAIAERSFPMTLHCSQAQRRWSMQVELAGARLTIYWNV